MTILQAIILGLLQGLTEFLPVSSSGHLAVAQALLGITDMKSVLSFDIALHVATLAAVVSVMWKDILAVLKKPLDKMTWLLVVATIPMVVIGVLFKDKIEAIFASADLLILVGICFMITAVILFFADRVKNNTKEKKEMTYLDALLIGIAQCIAILPGISRSGATISTSLFVGLKRDFAIRFAFLMSIPAILGPALIDGIKIAGSSSVLDEIGVLPLIAGMLTAGIAGFFAVRFMLKLFAKIGLKYFSYYLFAVSVAVLIVNIFFIK